MDENESLGRAHITGGRHRSGPAVGDIGGGSVWVVLVKGGIAEGWLGVLVRKRSMRRPEYSV